MILRPSSQSSLRPCLRQPFRPLPTPPHKGRSSFHTSPRHHNDSLLPNHYETLELQSNATASDIKRQFYKLSKTHHPDRNPNDPDASSRFVKISEAYATLGSDDKRQRYDREFSRSHPLHSASSSSSSSSQHPSGSYSSSSYSGPGGRPASGLSKRRTQFKGPPPSFYRSGGWGTQSAKRADHASRASHASSSSTSSSSSSDPSSSAGADTPPGTGPAGFSSGFDNDVRHFDREGHLRSQESVERAKLRKSKGVPLDDFRDKSPSLLWSFCLMSGILTFIAGIAAGSGSSSGGR